MIIKVYSINAYEDVYECIGALRKANEKEEKGYITLIDKENLRMIKYSINISLHKKIYEDSIYEACLQSIRQNLLPIHKRTGRKKKS